jgi:hypothetical protein
MRCALSVLLLALSCVGTIGCDLFDGNKNDNKSTTPTSPSTPASPAVSLSSFAGTWASVTAATPPTGCGSVTYTVTPVSATSANVTFAGTCGGSIKVTGSGTGTLSGSTLDWSAAGLVSQGGVNCPFTFTNSKATTDATGQIVVTYTGTVCGIPVSGTEIVKK